MYETPKEWAQKLKEKKDYRTLAAEFNNMDSLLTSEGRERHYARESDAKQALKEAGSEAIDALLYEIAVEGRGKLGLTEILVNIADPKAVPLLKKMLDSGKFTSSKTKQDVEAFVNKYPELHEPAEMAVCSLCGKSRPIVELRNVKPNFFFCLDTCWNRRGKIVGSKHPGALGCPFYAEGMCGVDGGNTCSLSFGSYGTTCYVYRIGTTRRF
jgi:hypothetical protein